MIIIAGKLILGSLIAFGVGYKTGEKLGDVLLPAMFDKKHEKE